jgi:hypothetical protein
MINWKRISNSIQAYIDVVLFYVAIVVLGLVLIMAHGCANVEVKGKTTHTVQGEATVRMVVEVDTTICDELPAEDRLECIQTLIDLAKVLSEKDEPAFGGI